MNNDSSTTCGLIRPTRPAPAQLPMFDLEPNWAEQWWGMPSFEMKDARPLRQITVNFLTAEDVSAFAKALDISILSRTDSVWFPPQKYLRGEFCYLGPKTDSRYPICIPSKGRAKVQRTGKRLDDLGVAYRFFVEETEYEEYCEELGESRVVKLPFSNLGQGSIPARNYIWNWAKERGHKRHWVVDDNISAFVRCHLNRRLNVKGGGFFRAMEDFVDRYENVALAGPHDKAFTLDRSPNLSPYLLNSRIYSCILVDTSLPYRWRGRYNEDTDLSLRALKDGYCTMLFRALLMDKMATVGAVGKPLPGGNTDNVYNTGDHRREFAESLKAQHPDVVEVVWKFNRWHHQVDYSPFKNNRLRLCPGVTPTRATNEYGMELVRVKESQE